MNKVSPEPTTWAVTKEREISVEPDANASNDNVNESEEQLQPAPDTQEQQEEQDVSQVEPEEPQVGEETEEEEPPKPSRRENLRISKLLARIEEYERGAPKAPQQQDGLDYRNDLNADDETIRRLEADRQAAYQRGISEARAADTRSIQFHTRLELDAPKVESKYKWLDPNDKENFNPVAANAMNVKYLQFVGYDSATDTVQRPNVRYSDFVEAEVEFANEIAERKIADTTRNIVRQAAHTGLRPDGSSARRLNLNKAPEQMTDEELEAVISQAIPPKKR